MKIEFIDDDKKGKENKMIFSGGSPSEMAAIFNSVQTSQLWRKDQGLVFFSGVRLFNDRVEFQWPQTSFELIESIKYIAWKSKLIETFAKDSGLSSAFKGFESRINAELATLTRDFNAWQQDSGVVELPYNVDKKSHSYRSGVYKVTKFFGEAIGFVDKAVSFGEALMGDRKQNLLTR